MAEYVIDEELARRAQESWSWSDYKKGSTTEYYNSKVAEIEKLAEDQKKKTDPMYHDHIDGLVEKYKRKLAENINARNANTARVPSVMIAGPANFPVRKKEKQNARENALWEEFNKIENIANQIKSAGTAGISADSDNAINKIAKKISEIEQSTAQMKAINAYYKKNKTLDGIEKDSNINSDLLEAAKWSVGKYPGEAPFSSYNFSGNSAEIRRLRDRLVSLNKSATEGTSGDYTFNGGTVKNNTELNRLQIFFDERPDSEMVAKLKKNGFHWSPSNKAWQRQTTDNAKRAIENYLGLDGLTSTGEKATRAYAISEEAQKVIDSANTKKAEAAARKQAKEERSKEFNDFLDQHGFYALSKEQLDEGRAKLGVKEGEKVISIGYGYFIDPKYKDEYIERFVKKKPSSKKAAPASAETVKVPNDVLAEKPAPVEKTEPNNKPAGGSFVSEKYVVDEHYIDNLHAEKAKPAEQPKSTATDAEKAISNMNPRLRERYERAFAKAKEKGYEIVQDKWGMPYFVTEKIEDEWSAADKTAAQKHLDKNGYILMTEYMTPSALDWVEEAGIKYTPKTPKSAPVEIKKSRVSQSAASEMPVAEVKAAEPPKPKETKKYTRDDIKKWGNIGSLASQLMAFYLPSKQFGRLYGVTDNFGAFTIDTPDGKEKKINYVYDPEWDAHVFYDNDNGRQLLIDVSNNEEKAVDNFLNLWPDIVEDMKENEQERIKRLQDPKYVAAEKDDIELEERIRKHNVDKVSFQDIPMKRLKVTQDFDGNVFAQTDAVLRTFGKGRKDDPYFDIKLAGKDDFIKGHGTKSYLLGIQASGFKDIKKDIRFDFKNAKPVDKLEKKEPRQRYTLLKFDHKNYSLKPREEVTDEERRDSKTGLKNSGFTDAVEIVEEYNGVPIFQAFSVRNENLGKNGKLPEFFAKTKNDDNFIIAKSIKDVKGLIDNHVKRYGKESLVSMPSATNKANADEKKYKAIENMVGGLVGTLTSKEFKEIKDEAFKNAKVASVTPPVDHSKEPVLADNDKEAKRYVVIEGIEFERGEFYIADMDNPLKTVIKPVKGVMATIKDAKGDDVPVGLYHDAAKGRMKFVDLRTGIDIVSSILGTSAVKMGKEAIKGMSSNPYEGRIEKELARINADKPLNNYYVAIGETEDPKLATEKEVAKAEYKTKAAKPKATKPQTLNVLGTELQKGNYYIYDKSQPGNVRVEKGYIGTLKDSKGEDFMVGVTVGGGPKKGYWYQIYDLLSGALLGDGNTLDETTRLIAKPDFDYHKATEKIGHGPLSAFQFIADAYKKKPVNKLYKEDWAKLVGDKGMKTYADLGYASREEELAAYVPLKHKDFDKFKDNPFEPRPGYYEYRNDDGSVFRQFGDYVTVNLPSRWAGDNNRTYVLFLTTQGAKETVIDPATGRTVFTTSSDLGHKDVWQQFLDQKFEFFDERLNHYQSLAEIDESDEWTWKQLNKSKKEMKMRAEYLADLEKVRKGKEKLPAKTFNDDGPLTGDQKKDLMKKADIAASSSDGHWALSKLSDRQLMELYKTTIPSAEFPEKQAYDAQLRFVLNSLPYKDKLMLLAKKEWAKEYTPLDELPKKSSAAKLTEPKKAMISWKQGAVRYGHGDDKKMKALWVVVTKEGGKWQAKFTTETPEGRKEEAGRPYTVKDSIKISGDIPADVQVQLGMFNVSFQDGKPVFKKIKDYVPKKKREKTEKSKIKLPTQKQLSKRI